MGSWLRSEQVGCFASHLFFFCFSGGNTMDDRFDGQGYSGRDMQFHFFKGDDVMDRKYASVALLSNIIDFCNVFSIGHNYIFGCIKSCQHAFTNFERNPSSISKEVSTGTLLINSIFRHLLSWEPMQPDKFGPRHILHDHKYSTFSLIISMGSQWPGRVVSSSENCVSFYFWKEYRAPK